MTIDPVCAVFAYGTLKRGQCRESCWSVAPVSIHKAWTLGELYDTGPYPALFAGSDLVAGEVWTFRPADIDRVLAQLDQVEEYRPGHETTNLYNRMIVECTDQAAQRHRAHAYFYGQAAEKSSFQRIAASYVWSARTFAVWPLGADW